MHSHSSFVIRAQCLSLSRLALIQLLVNLTHRWFILFQEPEGLSPGSRDNSRSPRDLKRPNNQRNVTYTVSKSPDEEIGKHLGNLGNSPWISIEHALQEADELGYTLGVSCRYIQNVGGKTYFYAEGTASGRAGRECWRIDPINQTSGYSEAKSEPVTKYDREPYSSQA